MSLIKQILMDYNKTNSSDDTHSITINSKFNKKLIEIEEEIEEEKEEEIEEETFKDYIIENSEQKYTHNSIYCRFSWN